MENGVFYSDSGTEVIAVLDCGDNAAVVNKFQCDSASTVGLSRPAIGEDNLAHHLRS